MFILETKSRGKNKMDNIPEIKRKQFNEILDLKTITTVYQPIVSLKDGNILGFEVRMF